MSSIIISDAAKAASCDRAHGVTLARVQQRIEAPGARPCHPQIQKAEAEQHREIAAIENRQPGLREMRNKERYCHVARQDEGDRAAEQSDSQQAATDQLDHSLDAQQ